MALSRLRPVDWLVSGYGLVAGVTALSRLGQVPGMAWVALGHLLVFPLALVLASPRTGAVGRALREVYPLALLAWFYTAFRFLNGGGVPAHDTAVQRWEAALFGGQPSRDWWRASPSAFWSVVLHAAYWAYYAIAITPAIWFLAQADYAGLRRYLFAMMTAFVICYVVFLYYPVAGPYYTFPRPEAEFIANLPARLVYATLASGSSFGTAFPSSHVAATLSATLAAWRTSPRLGRILILPALLLTVGTVYCQMHYAIDAVAGVVVALLAIGIGIRLDRQVVEG